MGDRRAVFSILFDNVRIEVDHPFGWPGRGFGGEIVGLTLNAKRGGRPGRKHFAQRCIMCVAGGLDLRGICRRSRRSPTGVSEPAFANITLYVKYQSDVSGELGGGTVFMGLEVRKVEISLTRVPYVTTGNVPTGFFEYALKQQSETLLSFSVTYSKMQMASESDPTTGPPPNCFIATACWIARSARSSGAAEVPGRVASRFTAGRIFIRGYYVVSPLFVQWLEHHSAGDENLVPLT
jgi:hypothetical protein